jgi:hypothetical protein
MKSHISLLLAANLALLATGCSQSHQSGMDTTELSQSLGDNVIVQFRRDALGAAAALPISPKTGEINGASTTIGGKLLQVHASSLVIEEGQRPKWIPREVILFVEANP